MAQIVSITLKMDFIKLRTMYLFHNPFNHLIQQIIVIQMTE